MHCKSSACDVTWHNIFLEIGYALAERVG